MKAPTVSELMPDGIVHAYVDGVPEAQQQMKLEGRTVYRRFIDCGGYDDLTDEILAASSQALLDSLSDHLGEHVDPDRVKWILDPYVVPRCFRDMPKRPTYTLEGWMK